MTTDKKQLFTKAHKMTKEIMATGKGSYRKIFAETLKSAWKLIKGSASVSKQVVSKFLEKVKETFTVTFKKVTTGEIRTMRCELVSFNSEKDFARVIDIESGEYRSFKVCTLISFEMQGKTFQVVGE